MRTIDFEQNKEWPLNLEKLETVEKTVKTRIEIEAKKIAILKKKLEDCAKINMPIEHAACDRKPLDDAEKEMQQAQKALLLVSVGKQIQSWKQGDKVTVYSTGYRKSDRESGFELLDYNIAARKIDHGYWNFDGNIAELEVVEVRPDQRVIAKSVYSKNTYMGIPFNQDVPIKFFKIQK